jgi:hypothetical protein
VFFHAFILFGSTTLYDKHVVLPTTKEDALHHMHEFVVAGCNGAIASTDATHIVCERICFSNQKNHLGGKTTHTARTYNLSVNHHRRILSTTRGHPARWNDKTLVLFDTFVKGIHDGKHLHDIEFELCELDPDGNVKVVKYRGVWIIVDNGYLHWSSTIPPHKVTADQREIRWSKWLESIRKDVECTFGILKGRWRILKAGIRLHGTKAADKIWLTCCALHNWLLDIDGLDETWGSEWEGELGQHCSQDVQKYLGAEQLRRISGHLEARNYDSSGMGRGNDAIMTGMEATCPPVEPVDDFVPPLNDTARVVKDLPFSYFRRKLVEHFDIKF